jgi:bifunctional enzyme CysN/CysC/sulfate adenylyltransferase subunit 1
MLGISRLVVAVNKMDSVDYEEGIFNSIRDSLGKFISRIGFEERDVRFVPVSAYNGENLVKKSEKLAWYDGNSLIDSIYGIFADASGAGRESALRMVIQGAIDTDGNIIAGRVISGRLKEGDSVDILPNGHNAKVKEIIVKGRRVNSADMGENAAITLDSKAGFELRGAVISGIDDRPNVVDSVTARIFVTGAIGKKLHAKFNGVDIGCNGVDVIDVIDTTTGKKTRGKEPVVLNAIDAVVRFDRKLPVEEYSTTRELGRFVLYSGGGFAGIGTITKI